MAILNPKEEQVIAEDEGEVQYRSRKYWRPELNKAEWELLNSRLKAEIGSKTNFLDESTKWLYAKEKGTEVFAYYGIGDGTESTVLYVSRGKTAGKEAQALKQYLGGLKNDHSRRTVAEWLAILSHPNGETFASHDTDEYGRKAVGNDFISGKQTEKQSGRLGRGNSGQSLDDSGDVTQHQRRTSPMTDREVLTIAANEISVEGLTDGERSALDIFKRLRLVQ